MGSTEQGLDGLGRGIHPRGNLGVRESLDPVQQDGFPLALTQRRYCLAHDLGTFALSQVLNGILLLPIPRVMRDRLHFQLAARFIEWIDFPSATKCASSIGCDVAHDREQPGGKT